MDDPPEATGNEIRRENGAVLRLLCDEMLVQLGHWLRAAGHDTLIARHRANDRSLVARAVIDDRILLTRDTKLCEIRDAEDCAILLHGETMSAWAREITPRLDLDWMAQPFSRCLVCNTVLQPAPELARARLPPAVLAAVPEINHCRQCDKLYWAGGHVRRMLRQLQAWREGRFGA
jgi:uncharacterized protein with PIN domain